MSVSGTQRSEKYVVALTITPEPTSYKFTFVNKQSTELEEQNYINDTHAGRGYHN